MAQDEQFTIAIPHMYQSLHTGERQLWEPELHVDVGQPQPQPQPSTAGRVLATRLKRMGGGPLSGEDIAYRLGQSLSSVRKQLSDAVANGFIEAEGDLFRVASTV